MLSKAWQAENERYAEYLSAGSLTKQYKFAMRTEKGSSERYTASSSLVERSLGAYVLSVVNFLSVAQVAAAVDRSLHLQGLPDVLAAIVAFGCIGVPIALGLRRNVQQLNLKFGKQRR